MIDIVYEYDGMGKEAFQDPLWVIAPENTYGTYWGHDGWTTEPGETLRWPTKDDAMEYAEGNIGVKYAWKVVHHVSMPNGL